MVVKQGSARTLDDLKGKKLSSNHLHNVKFVSRVLLGGKVDAATFFQLQPTNSPIKPFKAVDRGEADAALIDDAQLANMKKLQLSTPLTAIYSSPPLPTFPVVAFPSTKPDEREQMRKVLLGMCASASGAQACKALQIERFEPIDPSAF